MPKKRRSWQEKLTDSNDLPRVVKITLKMAGRWGTKPGDTVVIPAPIEVDGIRKDTGSFRRATGTSWLTLRGT